MSKETSRHTRLSGELQRQAEHTRPSKAPVLIYLVILFAVAFCLLFIAYFQQQRANAEATDALKESASAVQSIQTLMKDNSTLREENEQLSEVNESLEARLTEALDQIDQLKETLETQSDTLRGQEEAMDWFWQLDEAFVRGRYTTAREIIRILESDEDGQTPLKTYLPTVSHTDNGRFSPSERYAEIKAAVG